MIKTKQPQLTDLKFEIDFLSLVVGDQENRWFNWIFLCLLSTPWIHERNKDDFMNEKTTENEIKLTRFL